MHWPLFALLLTATVLAQKEPPPCAKPRDHLIYGTPESVNLLPRPLEIAVLNITNYTIPANNSIYSNYSIHPIEPGSVNIIGRCSTIIAAWADGKRDLYADVHGKKLPKNKQEDATLDTIYDMASLTKLFTTVAALQQMDAGTLDLYAKVASYIPKFAVHGKENITIEMLMTHTSGFAPDPNPPLYYPQYKTYKSRINAILTQKLMNKPGSTYLYSDLNFMTLFLVLQKITGMYSDGSITLPCTRKPYGSQMLFTGFIRLRKSKICADSFNFHT